MLASFPWPLQESVAILAAITTPKLDYLNRQLKYTDEIREIMLHAANPAVEQWDLTEFKRNKLSAYIYIYNLNKPIWYNENIIRELIDSIRLALGKEDDTEYYTDDDGEDDEDDGDIFNNPMVINIILYSIQKSNIFSSFLLAAKYGFFDALQTLMLQIDEIKDLDTYEMLMSYALILASGYGNFDIIKYLLDEWPDAINKIAIVEAIKYDDLDIVKYLISLYKDLDNDDIVNFLYNAARYSDLEMVKYLISLFTGDQLDIKRILMFAINYGDVDVVDFLLNGQFIAEDGSIKDL